VYTGPYVRPGVTHVDDIWEDILVGGFVALALVGYEKSPVFGKVVIKDGIKSTMVHMMAQYRPMNYLKNVFILPLLSTVLKVLPRDQTPNVPFYVKGEELGVIITVFY
jgi:hypothetical protein